MGPIIVAVTEAPYVRPSVNITNVQVRVMNVVLFKSVNINVTLFANNDYIDSKSYTLEGADYFSWGNDDNYIVNYALRQLGLTAAQDDLNRFLPFTPVVTEPAPVETAPVEPAPVEPAA